MPTYEYECSVCGHSFEKTQSMSDLPLTDCPKCAGRIRRVINGGMGVIFKGSGFYVNDARKGSGGSGAKPAAAKAQDGKGAESASGGETKPTGGESKGSDSKPAPSAPAASGSEKS